MKLNAAKIECSSGRSLSWLAVAAMMMLAAVPAHGATYKWVDENGVVHYTDKMPADAVDKATSEISKQGITIRKIDQATTPEQRRARAAEEEKQKQEAKDKEELARHDKALLDSYTSEEDIDLAKTRALKTIELSLQSAHAYIDQLNKRREALAATKPNAKDKNAPAANERELARIDTDLERQAEFVTRKKAEMATIAAKYDADKERYRAAKGRESQRSSEVQIVKPSGATAKK